MGLCTMKNAYSPTTHLAGRRPPGGGRGYNTANKRAVGAVADASNGEFDIMQSTPWRLTDCASTAYPHRRIQNTSFDCATPPPRTSTASSRPPSPCLWTAESTKPDSERGVGAILGGRTDPTRCPRTLHAIRETPTCAPGARCSVFLLALFARLRWCGL